MVELTGAEILQVLLVDLAAILGFYALFHRLFVMPERERRRLLYERIEVSEKKIAYLEGWRDAHDETHTTAVKVLNDLVKETKVVSERLVAVETTLNERNRS